MIKHMGTIAIGNIIAQTIQFGALLILSRIYLPDDFGALAQIQSLATILAILATLQLHLILPLSRSDISVQKAIYAIEFIGLCVLVVGAVLVSIMGPIIQVALLMSFFLGMTNTYTSFLIYRANFKLLASVIVARAAVAVSLQIFLALLDVGNGLIWGAVITEIAFAIGLRLKLLGISPLSNYSPRGAIELARENKDFSVFGTQQEIISVIAFLAPLFLFAIKYDDATAGQYSMASRLIWAPTVLISRSIAQTLYHYYGQMDQIRLGTQREIRLYFGLITCIVIGLSVLFLFPDIVIWVVGAQWGLAGEMTMALAIWASVFLLSTPFRVLVRVLRMQKHQLVLDGILLCLFLGLYAFYNGSAISQTWALVVCGAIQSCVLIGMVLQRIRQSRVSE